MRIKKVFFSLLIFLLLFSAAVSARDWQKYPAWIEISGARKVIAIGDVHGAFEEFASTLEALKVAERIPGKDFEMTWTAEDVILVTLGDYCDRGLHTREVMELIMSLEKQAPAHNSVMLPLLGNHEALLLNGQVEEWAKTLTSHKKKHYQNTIDSFTNGGYDFHQAISKTGKYGEWIRNRPLFAVINGFMFCHAGLPNKPTTRSSLAADFQDDIERDDWKAGMFMNMEGVLWNREWWLNDDLVTKNLQVLGVHGIAFGHTIGALSAKGKIAIKDNRLISCDVGMTPAYGNSKGGGLLMNVTSTGRLVFRAVYPDKPEELLFHMRLPASAATNRAVVNH